MRRRSPGLSALIGVAASVLATAALAADLPVPGPAPVAPVYRPLVYNWNGFYIGGHVGGGWSNDTFTALNTDPATFQIAGTATKITGMGVIGGAQVGFNIQIAPPIVIGFEGTWTSSNVSGTQITPAVLSGASEKATTNAIWYATATGRLGYAFNELLVYAKGGAAWMSADYSEQPISAQGYNSLVTINDTRTGWTVGAGFEYGINENLSIKVEYDYLGFGTKNYTFNNLSYNLVPALPAPGTQVVLPLGPQSFAIKSTAQLVSAGINYRFVWGGGAF